MSLKLPIICLLCSTFLVFIPHANAQEPKVDDLAKQLAKEIAKAKIKSLIVAPFVDGADSREGKILAARLEDYWILHNEKFLLLDRCKLQALLGAQKLTQKDLDNSETLQRIGLGLHVDALLSGTIATSSEGLSVNVFVRRVQDLKIECSASKSFPRSVFPARVGSATSDDTTSRPARAGVNGIGYPRCVYCPNPDYPTELHERVQAVVMLEVTITAEGCTTGIIVIKAPNDLLARRAVEAVRNWRFRPATNTDGDPVAARATIEMQFRFFGS